MKQRLAALVLGCIALSPLAGQAQIDKVTLYGSLNLNFELIKGEQTDGINPVVNRLSSNSSRLGVRGAEYLGAGQVAIFQIESSINADTNSGDLGGRETFVGLQGDWGTFKMGQFLTPYDDI